MTTIPEFLEKRFDGLTRTLIALLLIISFVTTLLPIVLYTGAINIESIFEISDVLNVSKIEGLWITVLVVGIVGATYAIFGGLKMVAYTDTINGYGLLIAGLLVPVLALWDIGDGNIWTGLVKVFHHAPEKFNIFRIGTGPSPFDVMNTEFIQLFSDFELVIGRKRNPFALCAVAEGSVVKEYLGHCFSKQKPGFLKKPGF